MLDILRNRGLKASISCVRVCVKDCLNVTWECTKYPKYSHLKCVRENTLAFPSDFQKWETYLTGFYSLFLCLFSLGYKNNADNTKIDINSYSMVEFYTTFWVFILYKCKSSHVCLAKWLTRDKIIYIEQLVSSLADCSMIFMTI